MRQKRPAEAKPFETSALEFYRVGGYRQELTSAIVGIADRLIEEAETDRAKLSGVLVHAREAFDSSRAIGDKRGEHVALGRIMHVQLLEANWPSFLENARRQERLLAELGEPPDLMQQVYPLWSLGREADARAMLERAVALRKQRPGRQPRLEFREALQRVLMAFQSRDRQGAVGAETNEIATWATRGLDFPDDVAGIDLKTWLRGLRWIAGSGPAGDRAALEKAAVETTGANRAQALAALVEGAAERGDTTEVRRRAPEAWAACQQSLGLDRALWIAWMAERAGLPEARRHAEELWARISRNWNEDDRQRYLARPYVRRLRGQ